MPIPTGGLIEVTFQQSFGDISIANVFYYWNTLNIEPSSFVALAADFDATIVVNAQSIQSLSISYDNIRVKTVLGVLPDLVVSPSVPTGTLAGDSLPSFAAAGFLLQGETKETRPGSKRFVGLTEDVVTSNQFTGGYIIALDAFALFLDDDLFDGANTYDPVIFGRITPSRPNLAANKIISAVRSDFVTSQVSRKR